MMAEDSIDYDTIPENDDRPDSPGSLSLRLSDSSTNSSLASPTIINKFGSLRVKQPEELMPKGETVSGGKVPEAIGANVHEAIRENDHENDGENVHEAMEGEVRGESLVPVYRDVQIQPMATPPINTMQNNSRYTSCIIWVHLQASICTEWEHNSMVLTPGSSVGAKVTTGGHKNTDGITSILQVLARQDPPQKKPKTIHRCILQRASTSKTGPNALLKCHVCDASYETYDRYYNHLIDSTCARRKEAKDLQDPIPAKQPIKPTAPRRGRPPGSVRRQKSLPKEQEEIRIEAEYIRRSPNTRKRPKVAEEPESVPKSSREEPYTNAFAAQRLSPISPGPDPASQPLNLSAKQNITEEQLGKETLQQQLSELIKSSGKRVSSELVDAAVCPHFAVATLPSLSLTDHAEDQAKLAGLKVRLTNLLVSLLGENRLTEMGYPDTDILVIMVSVLDLIRITPIVKPEDSCSVVCEQYAPSLSRVQLKYRLLRREILTARKNIEKLLGVCVPERKIWQQYGWTDKPVETILDEIAELGVGKFGSSKD